MPSHPRLRSPLPVLFAVAATLIAAGPAVAQTISGRVINPTQLDGRLVYASLDETGASWTLQQRSAGGTIAPLPVAPFAQAPDADWGTLRDGTQVLVYSRNGRVVLYDPAQRTETAVAGAHDSGRDEVQPTLWNGTLGFWRRARGATTDGEYRLFTVDGGRPSRTVKRLAATQSVLGADLNGRGLALTALNQGFPRRVSVQVKHYGQAFRTVLTASSGELSLVFLGEPSWRGDVVYWAFARRLDAPRREIGRAYITRRTTRVARVTPPRPPDAHENILGVAADNSDSASPIWVNTFTPDEEDEARQPGSTLYPLPVNSLSFAGSGPPVGPDPFE